MGAIFDEAYLKHNRERIKVLEVRVKKAESISRLARKKRKKRAVKKK